MSYRSHSDESNGSSLEDGEDQEKSLKTPSPERAAFSQGNGGKGMRTLEVELEVEHVGLGAEVEGRVW